MPLRSSSVVHESLNNTTLKYHKIETSAGRLTVLTTVHVVATLLLGVATQFEVLAALDRQHTLGLALGALDLQHDLLGGLGLRERWNEEN